MSAVHVEPRPAGLFRRLFAIVYDAMLLTAVVMGATALLLPITGGEAVAAGNVFFQLYLLLVGFGFFALFWLKGGSTLGMQAWRLKVVQPDGSPITLEQAARRYLAALLSWAALGLGFLWSLVDPERRTWHDLLSGTRLVHTPRR